jgi:hypothetical protein
MSKGGLSVPSRVDEVRSASPPHPSRHRNVSHGWFVCGLSVVLGIGLSVTFADSAFAASVSAYHHAKHQAQQQVRPTIASTQATFTIPPVAGATWTLRLWSHARRQGQITGTSGTLSLPVPTDSHCNLQADVLVKRPGGYRHFYSGQRVIEGGCGKHPTVGNQLNQPPGLSSSGGTGAGSGGTGTSLDNGVGLAANTPVAHTTGASLGSGNQLGGSGSQLAFTGINLAPMVFLGGGMLVLAALLFGASLAVEKASPLTGRQRLRCQVRACAMHLLRGSHL